MIDHPRLIFLFQDAALPLTDEMCRAQIGMTIRAFIPTHVFELEDLHVSARLTGDIVTALIPFLEKPFDPGLTRYGRTTASQNLCISSFPPTFASIGKFQHDTLKISSIYTVLLFDESCITNNF
jgi:hypothetical protein